MDISVHAKFKMEGNFNQLIFIWVRNSHKYTKILNLFRFSIVLYVRIIYFSGEPLLLLGEEHSQILSKKGTSFSYTVFSLRPGDPANADPSRRSLINLAKVMLMRFTAKKAL